AEYWFSNLRETVRFDQATRSLLKDGFHAFIETGPHPVLNIAITETIEQESGRDGRGHGNVAVLGSLRRDDGGLSRFLTSLAQAWVNGVDVDWRSICDGADTRRVSLPAYAFQRRRFWLEDRGRAGSGDVGSVGLVSLDHPILGAVVELDEGEVLFSGRLSLDGHTWLADHTVAGEVLLAGAVFVDVVLRAGEWLGCGALRELVLESPLRLSEGCGVRLQVLVGAAEADGARSVIVRSCAEGGLGDAPEWVRHASGALAEAEGEERDAVDGVADLGRWPPPEGIEVEVSEVYDRLLGLGLEYGPAFQALTGAWVRGDEVFCEVSLPEGAAEHAPRFGLHPILLDAALHGAVLIGGGSRVDAGRVRLPFSWERVRVDGQGAVSSLRARLSGGSEGSVALVGVGAGGCVVSVGSLTTRELPIAALRAAGSAGGGVSLLGIRWVPAPAREGASRFDGQEARFGVDGGIEDCVLIGSDGGSALARGFAAADVGVLSALDDVCDGDDPPSLVFVDVDGFLGDMGAGAADAADGVAGRVLGLLGGWLDDQRFADSRLVFVTRGAVAAGVGEGSSEAGLAAAAVWGLVGSAQAEEPGRFVLVDVGENWGLAPAALDAATGGELSELLEAVRVGEDRVVVRDGGLFVARLGDVDDGVLTVSDDLDAWCLEPGGDGSFEGLRVAESSAGTRELGAGEVRVAVRAAGMNFRDVLIALGTYPDDGFLGGEGAGVVIEVGLGVEGLCVGDRVMGLMERAFGSVAVSDARLLVRIPSGWSFVHAAAVPAAFSTAFYALVDLARLRDGERVLVHAATGGVGSAAVQIARWLGAEVFATASPAKWGVLSGMGFDGSHVASSRTPEFKQLFSGQTGGEGVDVVLDSLAGELVDASLELLADGGRFVEMGLSDVRDPDLLERERGISYHAFVLAQAGPQRIQEMLRETVDLFGRGVFTHPRLVCSDVRRAPEAFRHMSRARHVGKIVLTLPNTFAVGGRGGVGADPGGVSAGTVLVTGGTGVIGGATARHLVTECGVRSLVLASRRGEAAPGAPALREELERLGAVHVDVVACDVSDREQLSALLAGVPEALPLRGVVHAAGALEDGTVRSLSTESLRRVFAPKLQAAWHLHELTEGMDLAMFVLFSSVAATLGAPGQGNYAAANSFLDRLASFRRAHGLAGVSIAWGYWQQQSEMTETVSSADHARMARAGMLPLAVNEALGLFDDARRAADPAPVAMRLDHAVIRSGARAGALPSLLSSLAAGANAGLRHSRREARKGSLTRMLAAAGSPAERENIALELVLKEVAIVLGHPTPAAIDPDRPFKELGFDSLTAVELRNRLNGATGLNLPATTIFDHPTAIQLTRTLVEHAEGVTHRAALDPEEERLRTGLALLPVSKLREAGVLDTLLALLDSDGTEQAPRLDAEEEIEAMDAEGLIEAALGGSGT
ncbi:MAG: SDR family NAD(P)-dependent oxidoreductase, partial [Solirubrobacteraceae bacterium]